MPKKNNPSKPPDPPPNVDWEKVNAKYWATVDRWIEQGIDVPATRQRLAMLAGDPPQPVNIPSAKPSVKPPPKPRVTRAKKPDQLVGRGRKPQFDVDAAVERYQAGDYVSEIAKDLGCINQTVVSYLKKAGVYVPHRDAGRQRRGSRKQEVCQRGHNMEKHGRPIWGQGPGGVKVQTGSYCRTCKTMNARGGNS